jgi:hypothetical protein
MASRGSALQRALKYFRESDVDEMRVAFTLAKEIVERRLAMVPRATEARQPRQRTRKPKPAESPVAASRDNESLASA